MQKYKEYKNDQMSVKLNCIEVNVYIELICIEVNVVYFFICLTLDNC